MAARSGWRNSALSSELTLPSSAARLPSSSTASGFSSTSDRSFSLNSLYRPSMILVSWLTCLAFRSMAKPSWRHWYGCRPSTKSIDDGVDVFGCFLGDLLDVHAAVLGGDERDRLGVAIDQDRQVQLLGDVGGVGDQHQVHRQRAAAGLVGFHVGAEHALGGSLHLVEALAELHAAGLAAAAGVDLRLDHPLGAAQLPWRHRRRRRASWRPCPAARRCRTARTVLWPGIRGNSFDTSSERKRGGRTPQAARGRGSRTAECNARR